MARFPVHMIHLNVKKVGRILPGGGWRSHRRDTLKARDSKRGKSSRGGHTYPHTAIDGFSHLAYAEAPGPSLGLSSPDLMLAEELSLQLTSQWEDRTIQLRPGRGVPLCAFLLLRAAAP